jgi:hypothetical protein
MQEQMPVDETALSARLGDFLGWHLSAHCAGCLDYILLRKNGMLLNYQERT